MSNIKQRVILKFKDDAFVTQLSDLLMKTGKVKVVGLGIFEVRDIPEREGFSVQEKKRITIPAYKKIAFRPTKALKELVQKYGETA